MPASATSVLEPPPRVRARAAAVRWSRWAFTWSVTLTISLLALVGVMTLVAPTSFVCSYDPSACTARTFDSAPETTPRLIAPADQIPGGGVPTPDKANR